MLLVLCHSLIAAAIAWSPAAHRAMAERAVALEAEVAATTLPSPTPALPNPAEVLAFARAAAGEDLNLARKWARWHHYWFPRPLGVRRPSHERAAALIARLPTAVGAERWRLAGLLAHHVQDMASPEHVVPVHHGIAGGFEHVDVSGRIVASTAAPLDLPIDALQPALVAKTRAALEAPLSCDGLTLVPLRDLWVPADPAADPAADFGRPGPVRYGGLPACDAAFDVFTAARVDDAVAWTRAVVRTVAALDAAPAYVSTSTRTPIDPPR